MRAHRPGWAVGRVAIAVAALYALVLQAVLGGLIPASTLDPAYVICVAAAAGGDAAGGDGHSAPDPSHGHLPCCTLAHASPMANPPPTVTPVAVPWPRRRVAAVAWPPEIVSVPRAPPGVSASARAPPAV